MVRAVEDCYRGLFNQHLGMFLERLTPMLEEQIETVYWKPFNTAADQPKKKISGAEVSLLFLLLNSARKD